MHEASRVEPQANGGRVFVVIVIPFKSIRWESTKICRVWYSLISYGDIGKFIKKLHSFANYVNIMSSDYLVAGHVNKMQYVALLMMVARHVGLKPGVFMHVVDNLHIYDRHIDQAKELLSRTPSEKQPKLILKEGKTNFYDFTLDDFELIDYEPVKPQLKFDLGI